MLHYDGCWINDLLVVIAQGIFILTFNGDNTFSTVERKLEWVERWSSGG